MFIAIEKRNDATANDAATTNSTIQVFCNYWQKEKSNPNVIIYMFFSNFLHVFDRIFGQTMVIYGTILFDIIAQIWYDSLEICVSKTKTKGEKIL